ncbi:MAG: C39 family peptidase [Anaerolineae bacterium]
MYHHFLNLNSEKSLSSSYEWEETNCSAFDELLISWNAARPQRGAYAIYVSVNIDEWTPWLLYARWTSTSQRGCSTSIEGSLARVYQDAVEVLEEKKGKGFRVRVVAEEGAVLDHFSQLHVCASDMKTIQAPSCLHATSSIALPLKGLSQRALADARTERLCSPTSTTAVVRYLLQKDELQPLQFAEHVWDAEFDIFGNWVFNVAQAYAELGRGWSCWVSRLSGFDEVFESLKEGMPVVISVRSPLVGSASTYSSGHLIAIKGYDSEKKEVLCMDPAFKSDEETDVRYALDDLLQAWERRKWVAYLFKKNSID